MAYLHTAIVGHQLILELRGPELQLSEVVQQVLVHHGEFTTQHTAHVNVAGVGLKALVVAEDLAGAGSGHGGKQQAVAHTIGLDVSTQRIPVPKATAWLQATRSWVCETRINNIHPSLLVYSAANHLAHLQKVGSPQSYTGLFVVHITATNGYKVQGISHAPAFHSGGQVFLDDTSHADVSYSAEGPLLYGR